MDVIAIDSSALVAIILLEPDFELLVARISNADRVLISPVSLVECGIVLERRLGPQGSREIDELLRRFAIEIFPIDVAQARTALLAHWRFGRGLHPAGLNFGDCFSYALAKSEAIPLLFKGNDFSQTDVLT